MWPRICTTTMTRRREGEKRARVKCKGDGPTKKVKKEKKNDYSTALWPAGRQHSHHIFRTPILAEIFARGGGRGGVYSIGEMYSI